MAWASVMPRWESIFRRHGWNSTAAFLAWGGILVNRHRDRQVESVSVGEHCFYLKKQFAVTWRERFLNAWHGFGWCSTAVREAKILQDLKEARIGCPAIAAYGEDRRQAFVLLNEATGMTELRRFLQQLRCEDDRRNLAVALGRELARLHDAGFDHPDLFAKHVLVSQLGATFRFCFLDWQRGRRRRTLSWRLRCRDLAVLDASLNHALASDRLRLRCLSAYLTAIQAHRNRPPLSRLARRLRREAEALRKKRNVRELAQLPIPPKEQQLVSLYEGRLLIVRSYFETLPSSEPEAQASVKLSPSLALRAQWQLPPLAHTLFRLHRFGVPAPRLLAAACTPKGVYLLCTQEPATPLEQALIQARPRTRCRWLRQAGWIVRQIHEAGYSLPPQQCWERLIGVHQNTGEVMLAAVEPLQPCSSDWQTLARQELPHQHVHGSRTDRLIFLHGYLGQTSRNKRERLWIKSLLSPDERRWERQAVS